MATALSAQSGTDVSATQMWEAACALRHKATPVTRLRIVQTISRSSGRVRVTAKFDTVGLFDLAGRTENRDYALFPFPDEASPETSLRTVRDKRIIYTPLLFDFESPVELSDEQQLAACSEPDDFPDSTVRVGKLERLSLQGEFLEPIEDGDESSRKLFVMPPGSTVISGLILRNLNDVAELRRLPGYSQGLIVALRKGTGESRPWMTYVILPGPTKLRVEQIASAALKNVLLAANEVGANGSPTGKANQLLLF